MPRFLIGNFDFEHHLATTGYQPSAALIRRNAELAASWLAVAEEGDFLWCPQSFAREFLDRLHAQGFPHVIPLASPAAAPPGVAITPWGWTDEWQQRTKEVHGLCHAPEAKVVRAVNARRFSHQLELEWRIGLPGSSLVEDLGDLDQALSMAFDISSRSVIKANWGMSGRERLLVDGPLNDSQRSWLRKRLANQRAVFVEPWVELLEEIGIQIEIPGQGDPILQGLTPLVCDRSGQYRGSWCTHPPGSGDELIPHWRPAIDVALTAAARLQQQGYFGPVGIDAVRYRLPDGSQGLRPLQDINARWTMGRLSLGWRRFLRPGERAFWQHGTAESIHAAEPDRPAPSRVIDTSPEEVNGQATVHRSRLWIYAD